MAKKEEVVDLKPTNITEEQLSKLQTIVSNIINIQDGSIKYPDNEQTDKKD